MIRFQFDSPKTLQAVGVLLRSGGGKPLSPFHIHISLYAADRELLLAVGHTITGDSAVMTRTGPVLLSTRDAIRGVIRGDGDWSPFIGSGDDKLSPLRDPGVGQLSRREFSTLDEVAKRHHGLDAIKLTLLTRHLPERRRAIDTLNSNGGDHVPIEWDDVLTLAGRPELKRAAEEYIAIKAEMDFLFGAATKFVAAPLV